MKAIWPGAGVSAATVWRWMLAGAFVLIAGLNLPGHLSVDSVMSLAEGRFGVRVGWGPQIYGAVLGVFDRIAPGTGLYVAVSLLVLLASWAALPSLRPRLSWLAPLVLLLAIALPQVLIYQAVVWKDVLFANLAVAAFISLGRADVRWQTAGAAWSVAFAWMCLGLACLVRQNGAVVVIFAALALAWTGRRGGWKPALSWGVAGVVAPLAIALLLNAVAAPPSPAGRSSNQMGVRLVQNYDIAAAVAEDPARPLPLFQAEDPARLKVLRHEAPKVYSPVRIDTLARSPWIMPALWKWKPETMEAQWRQMIAADPGGYLSRRLSMFRWLVLTPQIDQCLPIHVGVTGAPKLLQSLQLTAGERPQDRALANYATWWLDTPVFSHLAWALVAVAAAGWLLVRREGADLAMAGMLLAALAFTASFLPISLACDYRYLYFLDLAAITGVLYLAIDSRRRA